MQELAREKGDIKRTMGEAETEFRREHEQRAHAHKAALSRQKRATDRALAAQLTAEDEDGDGGGEGGLLRSDAPTVRREAYLKAAIAAQPLERQKVRRTRCASLSRHTHDPVCNAAAVQNSALL